MALSWGGPGPVWAVLRTAALALGLSSLMLLAPRLLDAGGGTEDPWLELVLCLVVGFGAAPTMTPGGLPLTWSAPGAPPEIHEALALLPMDTRRLGWRALGYGLAFALVPMTAAALAGEPALPAAVFLSVLLPMTLAWSVGITLGTRHVYGVLGLALALTVAIAVADLVTSTLEIGAGTGWAALALPPLLALAWAISPLLRGPARPSSARRSSSRP